MSASCPPYSALSESEYSLENQLYDTVNCLPTAYFTAIFSIWLIVFGVLFFVCAITFIVEFCKAPTFNVRNRTTILTALYMLLKAALFAVFLAVTGE